MENFEQRLSSIEKQLKSITEELANPTSLADSIKGITEETAKLIVAQLRAERENNPDFNSAYQKFLREVEKPL